jgi:hypothetical protein
MNHREIFENLIEPLKSKLENEDYIFLLSRFDLYLCQTDQGNCWCGNPINFSNPDCSEFNLCEQHTEELKTYEKYNKKT